MALGISLLDTSSSGALALLVAIFASNLPEALGGAVGMCEQGRSKVFAIGVWTATAILLATAVVIGKGTFEGMSGEPLAVLLSFAGGAVLASLADTLMPDAYREGGPLVAFATAAGFLLSFLVSQQLPYLDLEFPRMRYAGNPVSESTPCKTVRKVRIDPKVRPRECTERR